MSWTPVTWGSAPLIRQLLSENRTEEAIPICRQYEVLPSRDNDVFLACSWVYYRTNRASAADALLAKLAQSKNLPEYQLLEIYASVARDFLSPEALKALEPTARQQYDEKIKLRISEAQKKLEPLLIEQKNSNVGKIAQEVSAEFYELKGQLEPAAFIYRGLINDNPKNAKAAWGLGRYYLARGDLRRAKTYLEKTTELWPKHQGSRYNLGLIYMNEGPDSYRQAAKWLSEAFKLNNADSSVLEQIGILFESKGKVEAAIKYWQRAVELNPRAVIASKKLDEHVDVVIGVLISKKNWKAALEKIELIKNTNEPKRFELAEGMIYRGMGQFDKAAAIFKPMVQAEPENPVILREFGIVEFNLGHHEEATKLFEKLVQVEKNQPMNFAWLGFALEEKKEYAKAIQAWNQAAGLFKNSKEIKKALEKVVRLEQLANGREVASGDNKQNDHSDKTVEVTDPFHQGE